MKSSPEPRPLSRHGARGLVLLAMLSFLTPCQGTDSFEALSLFKNPPREYSTGPLWVWNDLLTEQEIRNTLRDLAAQDVKQVWVHPRPGLMTPYLSADWFRLWKVALKEAARLDMNVWIYDENSYPSGFAGGLVPDAMPESRGRGLTFHETKTVPKWSADVLGVYRLGDESFENVSVEVKNGESMPDGKYLVAAEVRAANSPWYGNRSYVNLLSPGVTEKFLKLTLEPYRHEVGKQFGQRIPGVFSDEPNIRPAGGFPWSEILAKEFQKRWGYDLLEHLPGLNRPVGDWRKLRHDYFQLLNEQFIEHWSKPYHNYCASNHLEWTGHYWDHEWPNCVGVPDNMAMYAWHQRPAIDCLMNQYAENTHAQFGNLRMVKELSSVANQLGMKRTLCETYGAAGWDLRFEDMKRIGDWLEVLGVNTIDQHLSYVTIRGARKRDHPQSFSYHEPWWEAYHVSADYLARLSAALSQGEQHNHVLVLEPTTTAWMYQGDEPVLSKIGESFFNLLDSLEAAQVEYDIGCEDILARHGSAGTGSLKVGQREYQAVVLPPFTENLNHETANLLDAFLGSGGLVLDCGEPPARIDGAHSPRGSALAGPANWKKVEPGTLSKSLPPADCTIVRAEGDQGILFHHRRQLEDGELLFLVNTSIASDSSGFVRSGWRGVQAWGPRNGQVAPYPFEPKTNGLKAAFNLPPAGSLLLFLSSNSVSPPKAPAETVTVLQPEWAPEVHRLAPNILTLDYVDIRTGGETKTNIYFYQANQFAWQKNGMTRDPWDSAVQFKNEFITKKFPPGSGFTATYYFQIESSVPSNLSIVIERPDLYAITCNGQRVHATPNDWWLDKSFGRIRLGGVARIGQNAVTITASPFTMFHELEPTYVLGDFALKPVDRGFIIAKDKPLTVGAGDGAETGFQPVLKAAFAPAGRSASTNAFGWNQQGHPFYGAGVSYVEHFTVDEKQGRYRVALPRWYGSVATVTVNGKLAGFIDAPPWECEVTRWIKAGDNELDVTVIGTLKNTLGPHHGNPAPGAAWPNMFQRGPASGPPPGESYSTFAYGLFEPFVVKQIREPRAEN
jgi:hypothetical protein